MSNDFNNFRFPTDAELAGQWILAHITRLDTWTARLQNRIDRLRQTRALSVSDQEELAFIERDLIRLSDERMEARSVYEALCGQDKTN